MRPSDVSGTWTLTEGSRQVLPDGLQKASASLVLKPDGTFVASEMPGLFFFPGLRDMQAESGTGMWRLRIDEGTQVQLVFRAITGWDKSRLPFGGHVGVSQGWSGLSLYYFIGDADEGKRVSFERAR
ncbi:MAG: hypothetical protein ACRD1V_20500 [Vicinamibacterales bacterium]